MFEHQPDGFWTLSRPPTVGPSSSLLPVTLSSRPPVTRLQKDRLHQWASSSWASSSLLSSSLCSLLAKCLEQALWLQMEASCSPLCSNLQRTYWFGWLVFLWWVFLLLSHIHSGWRVLIDFQGLVLFLPQFLPLLCLFQFLLQMPVLTTFRY